MEDKEATLDNVLDQIGDEDDPNEGEVVTKTDNQDDPEKETTQDNPDTDPNKDNPDTDPNEEDSGDKDPDKEKVEDPKKEEPKKSEDSSVIRKLRDEQRKSSQELKKTQELIKRVAEKEGVSPEELENKLQEQEDEQKAKDNNISPEIQRELREYKQEVERLRQDRQREVFNQKYERLKEQHPMDDEQGREFVEKAINMGFDLGSPQTDFDTVYFAINKDSIMENIREEERQKVLKEIEDQQNRSTTTVKSRSQSDGSTKKGNLNDALKDLGL